MSKVKAMYADEMSGNKKAIPLESCEENELLSIQMKLDKDMRELQTNQAILKSVVAAYGRCINCVKTMNPDKFEMKSSDSYINDLNKLLANKIITKEEVDEIKKRVSEKEVSIEKHQKEKKIALEINANTEVKENLKTKEEKKESNQIEVKVEEKKEAIDKPKEIETKEDSFNNADILIPLTRLIYTPGKVTDTNNFFVRLGTNYYLQRNAEQAVAYFEKKKTKVFAEIEKTNIALDEIQKNMLMVDCFIKKKRGIIDRKIHTATPS